MYDNSISIESLCVSSSVFFYVIINSILGSKIASLVDSLAKSGFPLLICINVFLHTNSV